MKTTMAPVNSELTAKQALSAEEKNGKRLSAAPAADLEAVMDSPITVFSSSSSSSPPPEDTPALRLRAELHLYALLPRCIRPTFTPQSPTQPPSPHPILDCPGNTLSPLVRGHSGGGWRVRGGSCGSAICAYTSAGSIDPGIDASRFNRHAGVISQRITVGVTKELSIQR